MLMAYNLHPGLRIGQLDVQIKEYFPLCTQNVTWYLEAVNEDFVLFHLRGSFPWGRAINNS